MKECAFFGSFDPITYGHLDVIKRALTMFDKIHIVVGVNSSKSCVFSVEDRKKFIENAIKAPNSGISRDRVYIAHDSGLAVDYMTRNHVCATIRGIRNSADYEYEQNMALVNTDLSGVESIFIPARPEHATMSSSNVKVLVKAGVDVSKMVPLEVKEQLEAVLLKMRLVGIVGRSCSGKSTYIAENYKYKIDFDKIVKDLWDDIFTATVILKKLESHGIYASKYIGQVEKKLIRVALEDPIKNAIIRNTMKPYIEASYREKLRQISEQIITDNIDDVVQVAIDAPMLIEYGNLTLVNNNIIQVVTDYNTCVERIMKRDYLSMDSAKGRLKAQLDPIEIKDKWVESRNKYNYGTYKVINTNEGMV